VRTNTHTRRRETQRAKVRSSALHCISRSQPTPPVRTKHTTTNTRSAVCRAQLTQTHSQCQATTPCLARHTSTRGVERESDSHWVAAAAPAIHRGDVHARRRWQHRGATPHAVSGCCCRCGRAAASTPVSTQHSHQPHCCCSAPLCAPGKAVRAVVRALNRAAAGAGGDRRRGQQERRHVRHVRGPVWNVQEPVAVRSCLPHAVFFDCLQLPRHHTAPRTVCIDGRNRHPPRSCPAPPLTLPTMCSSVTTAMNARLPMMTTCCRGRRGNSRAAAARAATAHAQTAAAAARWLEGGRGACGPLGAGEAGAPSLSQRNYTLPTALTGAILMPGLSSV
jgi:hypothetical protein